MRAISVRLLPSWSRWRPVGEVTRRIRSQLRGTIEQRLHRTEFQIAVTVERGGNPFFAHPFLLKRSMIYKDHTLEDFARELVSTERF